RVGAIDGAGLAVGIGGVLETVQHLDLVAVEEEDAAVAATLAAPGRRHGRGPLDVKLAVADGIFGRNRAAAAHDLRVAVLDLPLCRPATGTLPPGEVFAVEENHRIRRRPAWCLRRAGRAGID